MSEDIGGLPQTVEDPTKRGLVTQADADQAEIEASRAPLMEHLIELRMRLIWMVAAFVVSVIGCYCFHAHIMGFLVHPLAVASSLYQEQQNHGKAGPFDLAFILLGMKAISNVKDIPLIATAPMEVFFTNLRIAMFGGIIVSFPVLAFQLYRFIAPGLYRRERNAFLPFLFAAPVLFLMGMALVYYAIMPMVLWFSLNQQIIGANGVTVQFMPKVSEYLQLVETLMIAFGCCFQLPIVITLLGLAGIVNSKMLGQFRRYAILAIVVVAAIVTPPDPISQCLLSVPIILLYEISILCVRMIEFRRPKATVS
ncbi:twin-arginine translocase subunit TatC [Asticcacaulis solisilvae]|uniref:twin-arginine translocase subunit TatC n=1 Tax=Asticcacaulis solisilvae TaxID=1217274 RepID=UPI003FD71811